MNSVIMVCFIVATCAFIVLVAFAVRTLIQVYKTAKQAEILLTAINNEVNVVSRITAGIGQFFTNSFSWLKYGSMFGGLVTAWVNKKKKATQE